jgi:transposase
MARPSDYSPKVAERVCVAIAEGYSLRQIAAREGWPDRSTILRWLNKHAEFRDQYARAREMQAEHFADEILEIADGGSNDWIERKRQDGSIEIVLDHEHVQRSRLRVDARKWLLSKLMPKQYGDKVEVTGKDGGPLEHRIDTPAKESREEWLARQQPQSAPPRLIGVATEVRHVH